MAEAEKELEAGGSRQRRLRRGAHPWLTRSATSVRRRRGDRAAGDQPAAVSAEHAEARQAHLDHADGAVLRADDLIAGYLPGVNILNGADLYCQPGELVGIIGPNGAGKSTLLKALFGLVKIGIGHGHAQRPRHHQRTRRRPGVGRDRLRAADQQRVPVAHDRGEPPDGQLPEAQAASRSASTSWPGLFPALRDRRSQRAGSLSGGERQMVAMGRALMMEPSVLLLDEPSAGLSPVMQDEVFVQTRRINRAGVSVVMVEQNAARCLQICDRAYVLDQGRNAYTGTGSDLAKDPKVIELYLGTLAKA